MRFELRPTYPGLPSNDRKSLHVDVEAFLAIERAGRAKSSNEEAIAALEEVLPAEVLIELQRPIYAGPPLLFGMNLMLDL